MIANCVLLALLTLSAFVPALAFAAPLADNAKDWQHVNGNSWAQNYSPQTQINKNNVNNLEVKWIFPLGSQSLASPAMMALGTDEGSTTPPVIHNGVVYVTTNFFRTYAVDMKTGKQLWMNDYLINATQAKKLPVQFGAGHLHGIRYWEAGDVVLVGGKACDFYGIDATTGKTKFDIPVCDAAGTGIVGNPPAGTYVYRTTINSLADIGTYEKGRMFIYVLPGYIHSSLDAKGLGNGRHVTVGLSMDAPYKVLWRVYDSPPYDQPVKDWALQECSIGYFNTHPCNDVAAKNQAGLEWDWTFPGQPMSKWGGVTSNWGQPVIDEDTGILYTNTGNQGPYSNLSMTPGPRLYGSTIMAIDMNSGKRIWWLQPFPHDMYDYDCDWSGILADVPTLGKVYMKGCKEGVLYAMDAKTGKPVWTVDNVNDEVTWGQIGPAALKIPAQGGVRYNRPDPYSQYDMRELGWISYPATKPGDPGKYCTLPCSVFPTWSNGLFATDMSYDPQTSTVIHYAGALQELVLKENPYVVGGNLFVTQRYPIGNTSIVARDATTGNMKWKFFYSYSVQRAAMVVSGGMVFTGFTDGNMRFLDKDTGSLLRQMNIGSPVVVGVTIGQDSDANSKIILIGGATRNAGNSLYGLNGLSPSPGTLIAIGLSDKPAGVAQTTTVTTTALSTTTATSSTTATTTVTTTSATTSVTTTTTTTATTVISTQPAQTTTLTSTTGLPSEVTYAAVGVAVIAILAAAVLVMRKK